MIDDIKRKYKEYLTKAQIRELAKRAELYKQTHAEQRAEALADVRSQYDTGRVALQNMGLASRKGNVISGKEKGMRAPLMRQYQDYNRKLGEVEHAYTDRAAAQMANETIRARAAAARRKAEHEAAINQMQRVKQLDEMDDPRFRTDGTFNKAVLSTRETDSSIGKTYSWKNAKKEGSTPGMTVTPKMAAAMQENAQNKVMKDAWASVSPLNPVNKSVPRGIQERIEEQETHARETEEWRKKIERADGSVDPKIKQDAERARGEWAKYESDKARKKIAALNPDIADLIMLDDTSFDLRYNAAKEELERLMKSQKALKFSSDSLARSNNERAVKGATERFTKLDRAKSARDETEFTNYYYLLDNRKADKDYSSKITNDQPEDRAKRLRGLVKNDYDASLYDKEHSTSDSKYAAVVNEYSLLNGNSTADYTFEGALNNLVNIQGNKALHDLIFKGGSEDDDAQRLLKKIYKSKGITGNQEKTRYKDSIYLAYFMTEDERNRFNAIYEFDGAKKADEYFEYIRGTTLARRAYQEISDYYHVYDENGNIIGGTANEPRWIQEIKSAFSVPINLSYGIVGSLDTIINGSDDIVSERLRASGWNSAGNFRSSVAESRPGFEGQAYQTGMSIADSVAAMAAAYVTGGASAGAVAWKSAMWYAKQAIEIAGSTMLGGAALNSAYEEGLQRGLSPDKAKALAIGTGLNEMIFEKVSIGTLLDKTGKGFIKAAKEGWVNFFVNMGVQGGVEASEEVLTSIANDIWDKRVNGIMADAQQKLRKYMSEGHSYEEAKSMVDTEFAEELGMDALTGLASGLLMAGGGQALNLISNRGFERIGKTTNEQDIRGYDFKDKEAAELAKQSKLTNAELGMLELVKTREQVGASIDVVEKAKAEGRISEEVADIYKRFAENGFQSESNPNGVTLDEFAKMNEYADVVGLALEVREGIKGEYTAIEQQRLADEKLQNEFNAKAPEEQQRILENAPRTAAEAVADPLGRNANTLEGLRQQRERSALAPQGRELSAETREKVSEQIESKTGDLAIDGNTVVTEKGSGKVTFDFSTNGHTTLETMTAAEKASLRLARMVAASTKSNIKIESEFTGRHKNQNGYYNPITHTLHVNLSGEHSAVWVMSHELTHHLQTMNERAYNDLRDVIRDELSKQDVTMSELNLDYDRDWLGEYLNKGMNLWEALNALEDKRYDEEYKGKDRAERVEEEVVARCCESFLRDSDFVRTMAKKHYRSSVEIMRFLMQFSKDVATVQMDAAVRAFEGGYDTNDISPENNVLRDFADIKRIADMWERGLREIANKRKAAKQAKMEEGAKTTPMEGVKASLMDKDNSSNANQRNYSMEEFERLYQEGVHTVKVKELSAFKSKKIRDINPDNITSLALKRVQSKDYKSNNSGYIFFGDNTRATVTENSFRHGAADKSREYMIACMNISELAKSAIPVNGLFSSEDHANPGTIYFAIAQTNRSAFLVRMVVDNGTGIVDGLNVLYAIKKESPSTAPASAQSQTVTRTDTGSVRLKELDELMRVSSILNIKDFLEIVNSFEMGKSSLSLDVLKNLNSTRRNEKRITPYLRYSIMDKEFRMTKQGAVRTFEQGDTTATVVGSNVELDGGSLLNRVRMMQNLAEEYGSVTVDAKSEKEAEAFKRAGAKQETDAFSGSEYGTWAFEHQENKYEKDTQYDAKQKRKFANDVLKEIGTRKNFTRDELVRYKAALEKAFAVLHNSTYGKGDQLAAYEYADKLFDRMLDSYAEMSEADADMRDTLLSNMTRATDSRGRMYRVLEVTAKQMSEIKNAYESAAAYSRELSKALGSKVFVKEAANAKTLEDIFTHSTDTRFNAETNEGDMPGELLQIAEQTKEQRSNPYKAESAERDAMKAQLWDKAIDIVGVEKSTAQKVREAVKEARAEERAKTKDKLAKAVDDARLAERMHEGALRAQERRASATREAALKQRAADREAKLKETTKERLEKQRTEQLRRDVKTVALKWNQRLVKMLANPTEASHIPVQLAREVAEFTKTLTEYLDSGTQRGQINLEKVMKAYQRAFDDQATISEAQKENPNYDPRGQVIDREMYDEQLVSMMNELNEVIKGKSFKDLSAFEMRMLLNTVRGVAHTVYDANRMIGQSERKAIWKVGSTMVSELENAPTLPKGLRGYLETSLDLRRLALAFSGSNKNAEFVKLVEQLNDGAIEKERVAQVLQDMFKTVTDTYGNEIRKWYGKNAEWIDTGITKNGHKIEITNGMRVSLAMHVLNEGNMRHIENGGLTIPNREMYRKGNLADAYANGELVRLNADQINEIISHMTEAEKAYVNTAKEFFHKRTGYYVNKTSLQLLGYRKATVENYFPIHTDKNFTKTDFASLKMDGSIEGQGFLKERVNASNPVYLEDITSVVNRQIRGVALYAGLAVPMRNFNAVMNAAVYEDENGVWSPRTTVKQTMTQKMGEYGAKIVEGFLTDVSEMSHVDVTPMERFAGKLATNYVKAVLTGNLKVAMKQVASYPTAAAVIPWKYLSKALVKGGRNSRMISRADVDLINQYTPLYQMRREGNANEIASIMQRRGMEQRLPWLLGWITKMDVMTVGRLWSAAEYMVADQQKNLTVGSDEYYKAVAKVFNDCVQQTQPNFTPLQRNAALRSKNPIVRSLVLFGTQRMQNGGIMIEAALDLKNSKGKSKAEIQAARAKLGRAVASQIVQNILLLVASAGVDLLRGRMKGWQDKDKEITVESVAKNLGDSFLSNLVGSFLGGSEVYSAISGLYKTATGETAYDTEFTVPALDAIETIINFAQSDIPNAVKYLSGDHTDDEKKKKLLNVSMQLAKVAGYATGMPLENAVKDVFKGIIPAVQDVMDWKKTGELNPWLHQSGKLDSKKSSTNYKEWTKLGYKGSTYFYWEKKMKDVFGGRDGRIPLLEESDLTNEQKAKLMELFDTSGATSKGTVVYNKKGEVIVDFAD